MDRYARRPGPPALFGLARMIDDLRWQHDLRSEIRVVAGDRPVPIDPGWTDLSGNAVDLGFDEFTIDNIPTQRYVALEYV